MATASVTNTLVTGTTITAAQHNTNYGDLVSFLNASVVHRDGTKALTADLPAGGNKLTGLGAGSATGDSARWDDVDKFVSFSISGTLAVESKLHRWYPPYAITIEDMVLSVGTAPTGAAILVDVHKSGTTVFTTQGNRPTVAVSAFVDTAAVPDVTAVATSEYLTVDVDQVGSTIAGADAVLTIRFRKS